MIKPKFCISILLIFQILTSISIYGQKIYKAPLLLIDEDFTDGIFDDYGAGINGRNWIFFGSGEVDFLPPNNRSFEKSLVRLPHYGGTAWSGAQWRLHAELPDEHDANQILFDKKNDIIILRFRAFSDVSHKKNYCGVEVAMLEQRAELSGHPHYGHDLSFESEQTFWGNSEVLQLDANVENTGNWGTDATRRAHFIGNNGFPTIEDLDKEYDNEIIWRNMYGEGRTNIETFSTLNDGDFFVPKEMKSELDPNNPYGIFSLVQITIFRDDDNFVLVRPGIQKEIAQTGIMSMSLAISRKSDFNLDLKIDSADLNILLENWETEQSPTIKMGDATNDNKVNFEDLNPLVGFWTQQQEVKNTFIIPHFDPDENTIRLQMQNISLVQIKGPESCFAEAGFNDGNLTSLLKEKSDSTFSAFTSDLWNGEYTLAGLNVSNSDSDDFTILFNYPGSREGKGIAIHMGEEFSSEPVTMCAGELTELSVPVQEDGIFTWEIPEDMLVLGNSASVKIKTTEKTLDGRIACRFIDTNGVHRYTHIFNVEMIHSPTEIPVITGEEEVFRTGTFNFSAGGISSDNLVEWELPPGFSLSGEQNSDSISVKIESNSKSGIIRARQFNNCGYGDWSEEFNVEVKNYTDLPHYFARMLEVYPNPAREMITIKMGTSENSLNEISIYSIEGKVVYSNKFINPSSVINLNIEMLPEGFYILRCTSGGREYFTRFSKARH